MKGFSVGELIKFGYNTVKKHLIFFVIFQIFMLAILMIMPTIGHVIMPCPFPSKSVFFSDLYVRLHPEFMYHMPVFVLNTLFVLSVILGLIISGMVVLGLYRTCLRFVNGKKGRMIDLFTCLPIVIKVIVSKILFSLMCLVGFVLFIFPLFILCTKFCLFPFFILEKNAGPIEALKLSAKVTKGAKLDVFALLVVILMLFAMWITFVFIGMLIDTPLAFFIGMVCAGIGVFFTMPVAIMAFALGYKKLIEQTSD